MFKNITKLYFSVCVVICMPQQAWRTQRTLWDPVGSLYYVDPRDQTWVTKHVCIILPLWCHFDSQVHVHFWHWTFWRCWRFWWWEISFPCLSCRPLLRILGCGWRCQGCGAVATEDLILQDFWLAGHLCCRLLEDAALSAWLPLPLFFPNIPTVNLLNTLYTRLYEDIQESSTLDGVTSVSLKIWKYCYLRYIYYS